MWPLLPAALASGLDADGLSLPVADGSLTQPSLVDTSPVLRAKRLVLGLDAAVAVAPLVRTGSGSETAETLPGTGTAYLRAVGMALPWLGGELHFPLRFTSSMQVGPSLGDLRANILVRPIEEDAVGLTLRLGGSVPTGSAERYAGAGVVVPRGQVAARFGQRLRADLGLGAGWEGPVAIGPRRVRGGFVLDGAAGISAMLWRSFGIGTSGRFALPTSEEVRRRRGVGAEIGVHSTVAFDERLSLRVQGSRALTDAAGFPEWRLAGGIAWALGRDRVTTESNRPVATYTVRDPEGVPVSGAVVTFNDGSEQVTDAHGTVPGLAKAWKAEVRAKGLQTASWKSRDEALSLQWAPTPIRVEITSDTGEPLEPTVIGLDLVADPNQAFVGEAGPGVYELVVEAEGYGRQVREVEVLPRRTDLLAVEVVLSKSRGGGALEMRIEDPHGHGIEAAEVRVDGLSVGTSANGSMKIEGLEQRTVTVEVESPYFGDFAADVDLTDGPGSLLVNPYYAPGTIRVVANGPQGPIRDGTVFLDGPRALAPLDLSPLGERLIRLAEGTWDILLSSPSLGLQERRLTLHRDSPVPVDLYFELLPEAGGDAELVVRVTDREGRPLPDVTLVVDGVSVGKTSTEGLLRLLDLARGETVLHAEGASLRPASQAVVLHEGLQEARLTLDWEPGSVQVRARSPSGPIDALATFAGPEPYQGGNLGLSGRRLFPGVPAGEWEVVASHELGMEVALTLVEEADPRLIDVAIQLGEEAGDATLSLQVTDPAGDPIEGARVTLDQLRLAATSTGGGMRVSGLVGGPRQLRVEGPYHQTVEEMVNLPAELAVELPWKPGVVDLIVSRAGIPLADAAVFFDGPEPRPAVTLGSDGAARVALGPGSWTAVVSSPTAGLTEIGFELDEQPTPPERISVDLQGEDELLVRLVDGVGNPVEGVLLLVDGVEVGETGSGGVLAVPRDGAARVRVFDPRLIEVEPVDVPGDWPELIFEVEWARRPVQIRVEANGAPTPALIQVIGPEDVEPVHLGSGGSGRVSLPPGRWELLASADGFGVARRRVIVSPDRTPPDVTFELTDAQVQVEVDAIRLEKVLFATGASAVTEAYEDVIEEIAATVIADPRIIALEVQGHTDDVGGPAYNFELSRQRAAAVVEALVKRGVPPDMVQARGFGQTRPIAPNDDEAGRAANRRVHFEITREDEQGADR